ncbi:hypothetical protein CON65_25355 [Bacillus pseudomycoides]|uniref:Uncharacterized protein n=1 Tax=Bacillus pseudomycoides TaxID=64104 RepID=A0AA91ZR10_9BACI|nr:hypothetical protein COO03_23265 [Bacillus sp. AFS098217]PED79974.1 hypothetical protein CON65_25355 [Bacillus pseudomycoides]PEU07387.1 hypothetical protein CN525_26700 [Bacillus sp. AFS014408]PFW57640.1 hypothetical protein COL20_26375 [Bacillus sp. AFS075034]
MPIHTNDLSIFDFMLFFWKKNIFKKNVFNFFHRKFNMLWNTRSLSKNERIFLICFIEMKNVLLF